MQDATVLTDAYKDEVGIWTPHLFRFLNCHRPRLPITELTGAEPAYRRRRGDVLDTQGDLKKIAGPAQLLRFVERSLAMRLSNDKARFYGKGRYDKSGIAPDIVLIRERVIYLIENKPFSSSELYPSQSDAYVRFVYWMISKGVACEYLVAASVGAEWKLYRQALRVQRVLRRKLQPRFGVLLYEDIFAAMEERGFPRLKTNARWGDYAKSDPDLKS